MLQKISAITLIALSQAVFAEHTTLTILTWEDYFDPELIPLFEKEYDIKTEFIYFDSDETRDQLMAESAGYGFDVLLVDEVEINAYITQRWVAQLDKSLLPNLDFHGTQWKKDAPSADGYAVPYGWGTYGITYRTDLVKKPPTSWADLFNPNADYAGAIQMSSQISELLSVALLSEGFSANETDVARLKLAEKKLIAQRSLVSAYKIPDLDGDNILLESGESKVAMTYSSDSLYLQDELDNLAYVTPTDGNIYWIDFWAVSSQSHKIKEAHQFLDFVLQPKIVAQNVEYHYSATFSEEANKYLSEDILNNKTIYPDNIETMEMMKPPTKYSIRSMMKVWNALDFE
jgi:spermidine/putrescine transport system substrate-binding protein